MGDKSMRDRALPRTCLSKTPHNDRVLDVTLHYFGCLKDSEKPAYFAGLPPKSKKRIQQEKRRIARQRAHYETQSTSETGEPISEAGATLKKFKESLQEYWKQHARCDPFEGQPRPVDVVPDHGVDAEVKAAMIYFKDGRPYTVPGINNEFPNQKIPVKNLLAEEEGNPLMKSYPENMIRYFHLPANNMIWVEVGP